MYSIVTNVHIVLFVLVFILGLNVIIRAQRGKSSNAEFTDTDRKAGLFFMISLHTQLLIGLGLYFISPRVQFVKGWMSSKVAEGMYRFYNLEHILLMIIAIALVTIGHSKSKKGAAPEEKFKPIKLWYVIGLLLILAAIPWPFRTVLGGGWF